MFSSLMVVIQQNRRLDFDFTFRKEKNILSAFFKRISK